VTWTPAASGIAAAYVTPDGGLTPFSFPDAGQFPQLFSTSPSAIFYAAGAGASTALATATCDAAGTCVQGPSATGALGTGLAAVSGLAAPGALPRAALWQDGTPGVWLEKLGDGGAAAVRVNDGGVSAQHPTAALAGPGPRNALVLFDTVAPGTDAGDVLAQPMCLPP
jgi:hypothetical protein